MTQTYDWNRPLPFGDSQWVKKSDVEPLVKAINQLLNNIYEFGAPTGDDYINPVEDALRRLTDDRAGETVNPCAEFHQGPFIRSQDGSAYCVACRTDLGPDEQGNAQEPSDVGN